MEKLKDSQITEDPEHLEFLQEKAKTDAERVTKKRKLDLETDQFQKTKSRVKVRSGRCKILSEERSRYLCAVYGGVVPEYTAFVYHSPNYRYIKKMVGPFKRFLFSNGPGMDDIRGDVLNICHNFEEEGDDLFEAFLTLLRSSIVSWIRTRGPMMPLLLNIKSIDQRFTNLKKHLQTVVAAQGTSASNNSDDTTRWVTFFYIFFSYIL
jgi:hypothetical protein